MVVFVVAAAFVVAVVMYLRRRLAIDPFAPGRPRRLASRVLVGSVVAMFGMIFVSRQVPGSPVARVAIVGYVMLALFFYLILALAVTEAPLWAWRRWGSGASTGEALHHSVAEGPPQHTVREHQPEVDVALRHRTAARVAASTAIAVAVVTTGVGFFEARDIALQEVSVAMRRPDPAVHGLRIAVLADIHLTVGLRDRAWMADVVRRVNAVDADLVVIVGDLVDGDVDTLGEDAEPLADLDSTYGTIFVTGNHEFISGAEQWVDFLPSLGIRVLRNEHVEIERNGETFVVAGVDDVTGEREGHGPDIAASLEGRDRSRSVILLSHQPVLAEEASGLDVDLQISGHTHGGQMWPIHYLVELQQGHVAGLERVGDMALYTSRGAGSWGHRFGSALRPRSRCSPSTRPDRFSASAAFQFLTESTEEADRRGGVLADPPVVYVPDGERVQVVPPLAALALDDHEPGALQDPEVLHHGAPVELVELIAQVSGGAGLVLEQVEETATGGRSQRLEDAVLVDIPGGARLRHVMNI